MVEVLLQRSLGVETGRVSTAVERGSERRSIGGSVGLLTRFTDPGVVEELVDIVALVGIDGQEVRNKILSRLGNVVPPRRQEGVLTLGDLLGQDLNALVVEWRETAEKGVENATKSPHVDTLRVTLILDNLGSSVADSSARSHGLTVPDDLGETKIGNLDQTNTTGTNALDEFTLVGLVLVVGTSGLGVSGRDERCRVEEQVLGLDVTVDDTGLFVHVLESLCDLDDDVS